MFKCKSCQSLKAEVEYLRRLVDKVMLKIDVAPVYGEEQEPEVEHIETREEMKFGEG